MRILVKENNHIRFGFWLPSWLWVINEALKHVSIEGSKLSKVQRKKIIAAMRLVKKHHQFIADITIHSHEGHHIVIKI
jgi:hypothetical protein